MRDQMSRAVYKTLEGYGLDVRDDYSGRCMYGDRCFGFVGGPEALTQFFSFMHVFASGNDREELEDNAEAFFEEGPSLAWDSMGMDMIFYFPRVTVEQDPDIEDDEEE